MRRRAPVRSHLDNAAVVPRGTNHSAAFLDSVTDGLLNIDVGARLDRGDGHQRMPVVRRRYYDDLRALALEHFSIILVSLRLVAGELFDLGRSGVQLVLVDVTHRNNTRLARLNRRAQNVHSPPTCPYQGSGVLLILRSEEWATIHAQAGRHRAFDEVSSITFHDCVPRYLF